MCVARVSSSVRLPDFAGKSAFRWTLAIASGFVLCILALFGFVYYWQTAAEMTSTINGLLTDALRVVVANPPTIEQFIGFVRALAVDAARSDDGRVEKAGKGCRKRVLESKERD
jgi:hypothetical protein